MILGVAVLWALAKGKVKPKKKGKGSLRGYVVLGILLFAFASAGSGAGGVVRQVTGPHRSTSLSGTLSCTQLERLWKQAGGSPSAAFMAAEIARAESGGRQYARDPVSGLYTDGTVDEGYFQINTVHGSLATYDPYGNARAAVIISNNGRDWSAWVTWKKGLEIGQC